MQAVARANRNFWTIEHYQKYFSTKISEVVKQIRSSISSLKFSRYFFGTLNNGKPDLNGSIWIIASLIITIEAHRKLVAQLPVNNGLFFRYDITPMYYIMTGIICYVWVAPLALLAVIKWTTEDRYLVEQKSPRTVLSLLVLYAFTLSTYSQFPLAWIMNVYWLQWFKTLSSTLTSAGAVIIWLRPDIERSKYSNTIIGMILAMYILEAAIFMLYISNKAEVPMSTKNISITKSRT